MNRTHLVKYLKGTVAKLGIEILRNDKKVVNHIAVTFKNSMEERKLLKMLYEYGAMTQLLDAHDRGGDATYAVDEAIELMISYGNMSESDATDTVYEIADFLNLKYKNEKQKKIRAKRENDKERVTSTIKNIKSDLSDAARSVRDNAKIKKTVGDVKKAADKVKDAIYESDLADNFISLKERLSFKMIGEDGALSKKGGPIVYITSYIIGVILLLLYAVLFIFRTEYVGGLFHGYFDPFDNSSGENLLFLCAAMFISIIWGYKGMKDVSEEATFYIPVIAVCALPLLAALGHGAGAIPCAVRLIVALVFGFFGMRIGKRIGKKIRMCTSWTKKVVLRYLISILVFFVIILILLFV